MKAPRMLSAPAQRVEAEADLCTERFSRTLDERSPHTRSSTAQIVPMDTENAIDPADVRVLGACAICVLALLAIFIYEWFA